MSSLPRVPDQGFAQAAREVVQAAQTRRQHLIANYSRLVDQAPSLRQPLDRAFPNLLRRP
ncbi:MAG: hypothetical protein HY718_12545 [Planctomycetes bacterium]|nr:hypothetical protein [Planctomycetota bacterium]